MWSDYDDWKTHTPYDDEKRCAVCDGYLDFDGECEDCRKREEEEGEEAEAETETEEGIEL